MTREEFIEKLREKNEEYSKIYLILEDYEKYINLFNKYFCHKKSNSGVGTIEFVFSERLAEENVAFLENWPQREQKIRARIKKNKYMSRGGKISDEKELRISSRKFVDLNLYFDLDEEFSKIENIEDYIKNLKIRKEKIEEIVLNRLKNKRKQKASDENQPQ